VLVPLRNAPRDYDWGSTSLLADLEGRVPTGAPEAEIWFGDHPADPAEVDDGSDRSLIEWLGATGGAQGAPARLPYLLKLLAAQSPLSIQAHPTLAQAREGFAREEAAGVARDAAERIYKDDNHKPEIIVALSDPFLALSGLREPADTVRLLDAWGRSADPLRARLIAHAEPDHALRETIAWALSGQAADTVERMSVELVAMQPSGEFAAEIGALQRVAARFPGDPGLLVALLMNLVRLRPGEGSFVPAGVPHAYLEGLGVELMAASDNVMRGGLTTKHIDVGELLAVLDTHPSPAEVLHPVPRDDAEGDVGSYSTPIADFRLTRVGVDGGARVPLRGTAIVVATSGEPAVNGFALSPGQAVLVTPGESPLDFQGSGDAFVAEPGR
jgi:mannose-6-phosphate isomerase